MTLIIKSMYSLHYYTPHLSCIHYSSVSRFELTRNAFNWSVFRSVIHQLTSMSTSVRLFYLSFFFFFSFCSSSSSVLSSPAFLLPLSFFFWKCFRNIYGERERAIQKEVQSKKWGRVNPTYKRRKHSWERKMNNRTLERKEREHGFHVIPIATDFYEKVYPSLGLHEI